MIIPPYSVDRPTVELVEKLPPQPPVVMLWINTVRGLVPNVAPIRRFRNEMVNKSNRFAGLGPGWLGPNSCEIPRTTTARILELAVSLEQIEGLPNPEMTPNIHGTISLEWESARGEAYLEYGTNEISGFVRFENEPMEHIEAVATLPVSFFTLVRDRLFPISQAHSVTTEGLGPYSYAFATARALA